MEKMDIKKLLVSFVAVLSVLLLVSTVSATNVTNVAKVTIDGVNASNKPAIIAGETVTVKVIFTSNVSASNCIKH